MHVRADTLTTTYVSVAAAVCEVPARTLRLAVTSRRECAAARTTARPLCEV